MYGYKSIDVFQPIVLGANYLIAALICLYAKSIIYNNI